MIYKYFFIFFTLTLLQACGSGDDGKVSKGHRDSMHIECKNDPDKKLCVLEVRKKFIEEGNDFVVLNELNKDQKKRVKMNCIRTKKYGLSAYNNCLEINLQAALDGKLTQTIIAQQPQSNIEKLEESVVLVWLEEYDSSNKKSEGLGHGSGVIINNKDIVTNCHVALIAEKGNQTGSKKRYIWIKNVGTNKDDNWALAKTVKKNEKNDICIIRHQPIEQMSFKMKPIKKLIEFKNLSKGDFVRSMGNPGTMEGHTSEGTIQWLGTAKDMLLPAEIIHPDTKLIVHGARMHKGSSGGPLFDKNGYIIGINSLGLDDSASENIAVSADHIKELLKK